MSLWVTLLGSLVVRIEDGPCLLKASWQRARLMLCCSWYLFSFVVLDARGIKFICSSLVSAVLWGIKRKIKYGYLR